MSDAIALFYGAVDAFELHYMRTVMTLEPQVRLPSPKLLGQLKASMHEKPEHSDKFDGLREMPVSQICRQ